MTFFGVEVPTPSWFLDVGDDTDAVQTGDALVAFESLFSTEAPDSVLVIGDVNPTLAAAIAAAKAGLRVVHLEAGMRCGSPGCKEDINRLLLDRLADIHLVSTEQAVSNLTRDGVDSTCVHFVGNVMAESVLRHADTIRGCRTCDEMGLERGQYALGCFHRPENLVDSERLTGLLAGLGTLEEPVVVPDASGLREAVEDAGVGVPSNVRVIDPVSYSDMLALERDAAVILTDSGGVQDEACMLGTPCVTVRAHSEHHATLAVGANRLAAPSAESIQEAVAAARPTKGSWVAPKRWDKAVSDRVARILRRA